MVRLGGFLSKLFRSLLKAGLPLTANLLKTLTKNVLIPLGGLTATA